MGIMDTLTGIKTGLFGDDVDTKTSTGPTSGTKQTVDSGQTQTGTQTTNGNSNTTGTNNQTSTNNGIVSNSGSVNYRNDSGSTTTSNKAGYADQQFIGGNTSTTTNSGRVDTSQVMLTEKAVDRLISQMMESNQGLAAVSSGKNAAGGYNSTAQTLLTNDLLTRVAGEVAVRGAKTVNTIGSSTSTTVNSGSMNTNQYGAQSGSVTTGPSQIQDIIGWSNQTSSGTNVTTGTNNSNTTSNGTTNSNQNTGPRTVNEVANTSGSKTKQEKDEKGILDWIICTELNKQGKMDQIIYLYGARKFATYDEQIKKGYYIWAVPVTKYIRRNPNSILCKFMEVLFNARAHYLAGNKYGGRVSTGAIATYSVHSVCWFLSRTLARTYNYNRLDIYPKGV